MHIGHFGIFAGGVFIQFPLYIFSLDYLHFKNFLICICMCVCIYVSVWSCSHAVYTEARNGHPVLPLSLSTCSSEAGSLPEPGTLASSSKLKASKLHVSSCIWDGRHVSDSTVLHGCWGPRSVLMTAQKPSEPSLQPLSDLCFYCRVINLSISWMSLIEVIQLANYFLLSLHCTFYFLVSFGSQSF